VKIATLLTQYLYTNHRLDLPGIGSFHLDPNSITHVENNKQRSTLLEGVSFENKPSIKDSPELIAYISAQTGKMKALAAADLDSHLQLAQQFLNIGKPFAFEGIGTLVKEKGEFEFTPGNVSTERFKDKSVSGSSRNTSHDNSSKYESFLSEPRPRAGWGKPVIALLILAGLGLAIWGGYAISKKSKKAAEPEQAQNSEVITLPVDTTTLAKKPDTTLIASNIGFNEKRYKYILEVAKSKRAFKRFNQLKTNLWEVQLETRDSIDYKLFLLLPAVNSDTTHIMDSLTVMLGKRVYIEHQN